MSEPARRNLYRTAVGLMIAGLVLFVIILTGVLQHDGISAADEPVRSWLVTQRGQPATTIMIILAIVFGPIGLPIIVLIVTVAWGLLAKHAWRPMLLAGAMLTGVILAQIIGHIVERHRPPIDLMLFGGDTTFSFPSGHVLGACDFLLVTTYLVFSRRKNPRSAVVAFIVAGIGIFFAAVSRLYLGYHWTDRCPGRLLDLARDPGRRHCAGHLADRPDQGRADHRDAVHRRLRPGLSARDQK